MDACSRFAALALLAILGCGPAVADTLECKNHYILSRPCQAGWVPVNEGLSMVDVNALAIDPLNPTTLYAGAGPRVFKSEDGARTWRSLSLDLSAWAAPVFINGPPLFADHIVKLIALDPINANTVYVATHPGHGCSWDQRRLFKSVDGGITWNADLSMTAGGCERITSVVFDPNLAGQIYFSHFDFLFADTYAPFRTSRDGGVTWNYHFQPLVPVLVADPREPGTVYGGTLAHDWTFYGLYGMGVLKSRDRGATWAPTTLLDRGVSAIAAAAGDRGGIYAATYTQGLYPEPQRFDGIHRTFDGGRTWLHGFGLEALVGTETVVTTLVAHPDNPGVLYAGTTDAGVFRTADGGATWTEMNDGLPSLAIRALATTPGSPSTLYAATPAGVFRFNVAPAPLRAWSTR